RFAWILQSAPVGARACTSAAHAPLSLQVACYPAPPMEALSAVGLAVPEVLLPARGTDLARWAMVACDQYTSEPEYWKACEERVGAAPSTLRLILPEVWLGAADEDARVTAIQTAMRDYLARGVFGPPLRGFVVVDRATPHVRSRLGLLVA